MKKRILFLILSSYLLASCTGSNTSEPTFTITPVIPTPTIEAQNSQETSIQVWYLGANGWALQIENKLLIFDYQTETNPNPPQYDEPRNLDNGYINPEEIKDFDVYVFVTHSHFDHVGIIPFLKRRDQKLQIYGSSRAWEILRMSKEEPSRKGVVRLGNPNAIRDFTDVRDMVQGYLLAAEKAKIGEPYNLGSGWGITIGNLVKLAAKIEGVEVEIEIDKERLRPADVEILICDSTKAQEELGFKIQIPMTKAVEDNIAYYKEPQNRGLIDLEVH